MSWNTPENLKYTETDEWILLDGNRCTAGITDYAQDQLSDVVFVELPNVGDMLAVGDSFGTVESVKAAAVLNMPVSGEITKVNRLLENRPEILNSDPFGEAWVIKFIVSDLTEMNSLMNSSQYTEYCKRR